MWHIKGYISLFSLYVLIVRGNCHGISFNLISYNEIDQVHVIGFALASRKW